MNTNTKQHRIESYIQLTQEWSASGLTQAEFARRKGISVRALSYRIRKARREAPNRFKDTELCNTEFNPVPKEYMNYSSCVYDSGEMADQPALMFQSAVGCLQVTNQIDPYLLKTAMEVMLSC